MRRGASHPIVPPCDRSQRLESLALHRLRLPLAKPYKLAFGPVTAFDTFLVEIREKEGGVGWGEATVLPGYTGESVAGTVEFLEDCLPELVGLRSDEAESRLIPELGRHPFAVSAVVSALESLAGDPWLTLDEPARVPLLAALNAMEEEAIESEIEAHHAAGYRTLKVKVGFDWRDDAARVSFIQSVLPKGLSIRIDGNQGFSREDAVAFARKLRSERIELFEQPCALDDWGAALAVAEVSPVPMMLDESIYGIEEIERAADTGAARFVKLKLMKMGGARRLAEGLERIRELGMQPVLGNGVATDIGCWQEAVIAARLIDNDGEMNGFLKLRRPIFHPPLEVDDAALVLQGPMPSPDPEALAAQRVDYLVFPDDSEALSA